MMTMRFTRSIRIVILLFALAIVAVDTSPQQRASVLGSGVKRGRALAGGTPLTTSMVGYWELNEAANTTSLDAHNVSCGGSGCDLTDLAGAVDTTTGIVGNARDFEASEASNRLRVVDHADVSIGTTETSFTLWGWVKLEAPLSSGTILSKYTATSNQREFHVDYDNTSSRFRFTVSADGTGTLGVVSANTLGAPSAGTWYFWIAEHNASANTISIQIGTGASLGAADSTAWSTGVFDGTTSFRLGALGSDTVFLDGAVDEVGFSKRLLAACEKTWLFNGGAGRDYAAVAAYGGCS